MAYPLQPLLSVRIFREDSARAAASAAEAAVRQAKANVVESQAEHERYVQWLHDEKELRYTSIMGTEMTLTNLDAFKAGLALLDDGELAREYAVRNAEKAAEERTRELHAAQTVLTSARKGKMKIEAHKDIWTQAAAKAAEHAAELELEEFTPATILQPPGYEHDQ